MKRRKQQPELRPIYVAPTFDVHQRAALRAWRRARFWGPRHTPKPGEFDPLWLRLGLRACCIDARAGWVISNPMLDQTLRRSPHLDESLGGPSWLRMVYRSERALVALPGVRAAVDARFRVEPIRVARVEPINQAAAIAHAGEQMGLL